MELRPLGHTGLDVSVIALGTWQLGGGDWGDVPEADAFAVMDAAAESGVNLFDTADVYGDGRSEILVGKWLKANPGSGVTVITKMGRRLPTQADEGYSAVNFRAWLDRSRANLQLHQVPLVQLHCPPTETYARAVALRRPRRARRERDDRRLRRLRPAHRGGARSAHAPRRSVDPDHPQRLPAQAPRRGRPDRRGAGRRDHRARPARVGTAERPVHEGHDLRGERPPHLQPSRRGLRRRRDVQRRRLRDRSEGGRRVRRARPGRRDPGAGRARVGRLPARRHDGHPRRPQSGAGPGECGGCGGRPPRRLRHEGPCDLRRALPGDDPPALVVGALRADPAAAFRGDSATAPRGGGRRAPRAVPRA